MADNLNIKNPSVTVDVLDLRTDSSGNIVSISGHSIAGGAGGGNVYFGDNEYVQFKTGTTNTFTLTDNVKDVIDHIPQTVATEVNRISYTKDVIDDKLDDKQDKLTFEYDEANKISAINGSALAGQGGTYYRAGTDIIIDEYNTIKVNTNGSANSTGMAFVEGMDNNASGFASHAEGLGNAVYSDYSHIEGYNNTDYKIDGLVGSNHTEGAYNKTSGVYSHNEGHANEITGYGVHVEGGYNKFYINNVSADTTHTDITNRWNVWGISIEGMANATTAEPTSGTIYGGDFGYIHGGILKVIGNGTRTLENPSDPATQIINRSDALIIYRDGSISAAGNISANGVELGAGGGGGTSYQGRNGVNVNGGYIELTTTAYESVTSIPNISNDVETLKTASGDWDKVSDKLDTTAFSEVSGRFLTAHQSLDEYATKEYANNASANALSEAETWVGNQHYLTEIPNTYALKSDIPTTVAQLLDSGNYYKTSETSGATELSTEFAKYVTSSDITTQDTDYVMTTTGWKVLSLPGGGMTQVTHDTTLTGQGNSDNSKLGVAWYALSGNTIDSAKSAGSANYALSAYINENTISSFSDYSNAITAKLDTTAAAQTYQTKGDYVKNTDIGLDANNKVTAISGKELIITAHQSLTNYYIKDETSGATEISTALGNKVDKPVSLNNKYLVLRTDNAGDVSGWVDFNDNVYSKSEADGRYQKKEDMGSYLTTTQYATDSATFATETELETVSGEITALIPTNYVTSGDEISGNFQYALTTAGWDKVQAGSTLTAGSGVEIVSNGINALLGTDLAFNATTSAIQINTNGTAYGAHAFVEGTNTTASGEGAHAEGADAGAFGQGAHAGGYGTHTTGIGNFIHGTFLNFASPDGTSVSNTPVFVGGTLNATSAQNYNDHGGYLQIMGNGVYRSGGQGDNSDAYILYRDGTVSAKQFQNADGTETINGTTYNFSGVDNIEILPLAATANTANFPNDNVLRFILES